MRSNARKAVKAAHSGNEFLESEVCELMQAASHAYFAGQVFTASFANLACLWLI
jgi:hypothetical protein